MSYEDYVSRIVDDDSDEYFIMLPYDHFNWCLSCGPYCKDDCKSSQIIQMESLTRQNKEFKFIPKNYKRKKYRQLYEFGSSLNVNGIL